MMTVTDTLIHNLISLFNHIIQWKETCLSYIVDHYVIYSIPYLVITCQFMYFTQDFVVCLCMPVCACVLRHGTLQDLKL